MNCIFGRNPYSGFVKEHSSGHCIYEHNPPQPIVYHINLGFWCAQICQHCKDRLAAKYGGSADIEKLPPWKLPPWHRPPRPPVLGSALELGDDDE